MASVRNKRRLAAVSWETQDYLRGSQSQNTYVPGITGEKIKQVSDEIQGRVTKNLSQDMSRTKFRILEALPKLNEFLLNSHLATLSWTLPGSFQNIDLEKREPAGDYSESNLQPGVELSTPRTSNSFDFDTEETSHNHNQGIRESTYPNEFS